MHNFPYCGSAGFFKVLMKQLTQLVILILALAACATAPVQEMSDARQAIRSAEAVGAAQRSPESLTAAQLLLRKAQTYLEAGAYDNARRYANDARTQAIQARETAARHPTLRSAPLRETP
jgi:prophage DNA circulation protein